MAGGLPRDLIRSFRTLFEERGRVEDGENDLATLCSSLIRSDLKSKLRAVSVEAQKVTLEPAVSRLFRTIRELESLLDKSTPLPRLCSQLQESYRRLLDVTAHELANQAESSDISDERATERERLSSLSKELGLYVYYSVTLLEFFCGSGFDIDDLKTAESGSPGSLGTLDQLVKARQSFSVNLDIAQTTITDFREARNMGILGPGRYSERRPRKYHDGSSEAGEDGPQEVKERDEKGESLLLEEPTTQTPPLKEKAPSR
jgi:hypothetical protein